MRRAECSSCGAKLPAKARFCPECGSRTDVSSGDTAVQELPHTETGPVPVERQIAERQLFGVPPFTILLVLGVVALAGAIFLFATGRWPWALILLGLAIFMLTGFSSQARRLPNETPEVARASLDGLGSIRARAGAAVETVAAHGTARIELARLRRDTRGLASHRGGLLRDLGEAAYEGNRSLTKDLKSRIQALDEEIKEKETEMANVMTQRQNRIGRAQLQVRPTVILPGGEETPAPSPVPEPATVPEPFPPPDEGEPPQPARIPEPFPPPGEGDRPQQPTIPEPGPE